MGGVWLGMTRARTSQFRSLFPPGDDDLVQSKRDYSTNIMIFREISNLLIEPFDLPYDELGTSSTIFYADTPSIVHMSLLCRHTECLQHELVVQQYGIGRAQK